jgi:hypothetical protein
MKHLADERLTRGNSKSLLVIDEATGAYAELSLALVPV